MFLDRFNSAVTHSVRLPGRRGRLCLAAAVVPISALATVGWQAGTASAAPATSSTTSCAVTGITDAQPGALQLTATDTVSGISKVISPFHINATRTFESGTPATHGVTFSPPTTSPAATDFTQSNLTSGSSGSLTVTNGAGQQTTCLGQFKQLEVLGGRADSVGFSFPQDRNWLYIQNGTGSAALSSVEVNVNGTTHVEIPLTSGEQTSLSLAEFLGTFPPLDTLDVTGTGPIGANAEVVVFGVGQFVFGYPGGD